MIRIPKRVYEELVGHLRSCYPEEGCGFLTGNAGRAGAFLPIENMEHSSISFLMDPKQQLRAFKKMGEDRLELLGIVHSHVASPAVPSQKDRVMAFYPEVGYVIVSLSDMKKPDLKAFRIADGRDTPEEVVIE